MPSLGTFPTRIMLMNHVTEMPMLATWYCQLHTRKPPFPSPARGFWWKLTSGKLRMISRFRMDSHSLKYLGEILGN